MGGWKVFRRSSDVHQGISHLHQIDDSLQRVGMAFHLATGPTRVDQLIEFVDRVFTLELFHAIDIVLVDFSLEKESGQTSNESKLSHVRVSDA